MATTDDNLINRILTQIHIATVEGLEIADEEWTPTGRRISIPRIPEWLLRGLVAPADVRQFKNTIKDALLCGLVAESYEPIKYLPLELRIAVSPVHGVYYRFTDEEMRNSVCLRAGRSAKDDVLRNGIRLGMQISTEFSSRCEEC